MSPTLQAFVRLTLATAAVLLLAFGFALWMKAPFAVRMWPWADGKLSYLWISSILLSQGATVLWWAVSMELNAACGGALGLAAMHSGIAIYMGYLYTLRHQRVLLAWAATAAFLAAGAVLLFFAGRRVPWRERAPLNRFMRLSFLLFVLALTLASAMLLLRAPVVFPWRLNPDSSVIFGLPFLASAIFFLDAWLRPDVANARGQLLGFFVYDVVLIPPYLALWPKTRGGFRVALMTFLTVFVWSAALAIWLWAANRIRHTSTQRAAGAGQAA
jgi:hypothetical protein